MNSEEKKKPIPCRVAKREEKESGGIQRLKVGTNLGLSGGDRSSVTRGKVQDSTWTHEYQEREKDYEPQKGRGDSKKRLTKKSSVHRFFHNSEKKKRDIKRAGGSTQKTRVSSEVEAGKGETGRDGRENNGKRGGKVGIDQTMNFRFLNLCKKKVTKEDRITASHSKYPP